MRCKTIKKMFVISVAFLMLSGIANAAFIEETGSVSLKDTNWSDTITIGKFAPTLGTLTSIEFFLYGYVAGIMRVENTSTSSGSNATLDLSSEISLDTQTTLNSVVVLPSATENATLTSFDYVFDWGGTSGKTISDIAASDSDSKSSTDDADLNFYTAASIGETIDLALAADGISSATGGGNLATYFTNQARADVTVRYTYDAAPPVPEPASIILLGTGIFGLVFASRKKSGKQKMPC